MKSSVLIGNGINRAALSEGGRSWEDLLRDLAKRADVETLNLEGKPLPLAYEEIVARSGDGSDAAEDQLKETVARWMSEISATSLHSAVLKLPVKNILTTNYDYALTSGEYGESNGGNRRAALTTETTNSLFRARSVGDKRVWHIHGECQTPRSILLGYAHYVRYTKRVQDYLSTSKSKSHRPHREWSVGSANSPLTAGSPWFDNMTDGDQIKFSWVDLFLRDDLHIIGFGCDFSEMMMWWLLTLKAKQRKSELSHRPASRPHWPAGTTVFHLVDSEVGRNKCEPRLDVLKALGVEIRFHPVTRGDYAAGYRTALSTIAS
jgi:SIR2-like domain